MRPDIIGTYTTLKHMDIVCYCHLRWNFVYQRPQHLLSRFASSYRVFFIEEPVHDGLNSYLQIENITDNLFVVTPHLIEYRLPKDASDIQAYLLKQLFDTYHITDHIAWYYTPMALDFTLDLPQPKLIVYDCMDELSAFQYAPSELISREAQLMEMADVVFTGGNSLYEAKRHLHHNIHAFPSSIDKTHFSKARDHKPDPADQAAIPYPRMGFFGVIDERLDIALLNVIALTRPDWHFILLGPIVKIDPATLPRHKNIHYLGSKPYSELPKYLAGWDVALLPFAKNEATRFISPTKTPEYLAGGKPVVSTSIKDVVDLYEEQGLVDIADEPCDFIVKIEKHLSMKNYAEWLNVVDVFLADISWDKTWEKMNNKVNAALEVNQVSNPLKTAKNV